MSNFDSQYLLIPAVLSRMTNHSVTEFGIRFYQFCFARISLLKTQYTHYRPEGSFYPDSCFSDLHPSDGDWSQNPMETVVRLRISTLAINLRKSIVNFLPLNNYLKKNWIPKERNALSLLFVCLPYPIDWIPFQTDNTRFKSTTETQRGSNAQGRPSTERPQQHSNGVVLRPTQKDLESKYPSIWKASQ